MKLARCTYQRRPVWVVVEGTDVRLIEHATDFESALALASSANEERIAIDAIRWLPPLEASTRVICAGINYAKHAAEMDRQALSYPALFVRFPESFAGHDVDVVRPRLTNAFDYEAELAVVIRRAGRHVSVEQAMTHVGGYTCMAENSARDYQKHNAQVTPGKNFDLSGALGPWIETADGIANPESLVVTGRLNGEIVQCAPVSELICPIARLIAYISTFTALKPGDVIATGTPEGVGASRNPPRFMQAGDVFEVNIEGVGLLRNRVAAEKEVSA
jgi:2-keto-4-pentenoate hydratase/2-oxohepta-3-ene-1,7-dioic acid hydratase in catechol pathway